MHDGPSQCSRAEPPVRRVGLLSTFPPKLCGLATFAAALETELSAAGDHVTAVGIEDSRGSAVPDSQATCELVGGGSSSIRSMARSLSACDVAIVQHEYGIYGGEDGDDVVAVLRASDTPAIVILHTVVAEPTDHQKSVLEDVCDLAARIVVMTAAAGSRLTSRYRVDGSKVTTIPHGASALTAVRGPSVGTDGSRLRMLTWGLLGPGKGVEHVIRALGHLRDLQPLVRYTVAGATHPNVRKRDGEAYRESLIHEAWSTGVAGAVNFDDTYRSAADLVRLVSSVSVVVLPYDSRDQVTSGVLVDAVAAGRPVIATAFPHAIELLSDGAGIIVPQRDPAALAEAIRSVVNDRAALHAMAERAREIAPSLSWTRVARQYRDLCDEVAPVGAVAAL